MMTPSTFGAHFEGPPCESPIESDLEYALGKYLAPSVHVKRQAWVQTSYGNFRLDFELHLGTLRVGVECDGADFHDEYRDEWRDATMLGEGLIDEVIRFAGKDLVYRLNDCLHVLFRLHPELFAERAHYALTKLASEHAVAAEIDPMDEELRYVGIGELSGNPCNDYVRIYRRVRTAPKQYWNKLYRAAVALGPGTLDELIERDKATWMGKVRT
jgi:hypothetical protein